MVLKLKQQTRGKNIKNIKAIFSIGRGSNKFIQKVYSTNDNIINIRDKKQKNVNSFHKF
jgi:hypothetical protein